MGLGDPRCLGAELGASSAPHANADEGLGLPRSPHSCEEQNCVFLEQCRGRGGCGGGVEAAGGPHAPTGCPACGWGSGETQPSHSDKTEPSPPRSHVWAAHRTRQQPAATCGPQRELRLPEGRASISYASLTYKGRINTTFKWEKPNTDADLTRHTVLQRCSSRQFSEGNHNG